MLQHVKKNCVGLYWRHSRYVSLGTLSTASQRMRGLFFFVPLENFDLCSALMAMCMMRLQTCLLWPSVYNGHLRGTVTLTPIAERLAVA